jgi:phosphoribosyl-AMP cyclohydrolase
MICFRGEIGEIVMISKSALLANQLSVMIHSNDFYAVGFLMTHQIHDDLSTPPSPATIPWSAVRKMLKLNQDELIPVIAQQYNSGEVLMLAWMNMVALDETINTGRVCYWSRSRAQLWRKGETSGQIQYLKELRLDCDADTILLLVDQHGPACHTGRRSCFFNALRSGTDHVEIIMEPLIDPDVLYAKKT